MSPTYIEQIKDLEQTALNLRTDDELRNAEVDTILTFLAIAYDYYDMRNWEKGDSLIIEAGNRIGALAERQEYAGSHEQYRNISLK